MSHSINIKFRPATIEDSYKIAQLVEIANNGVEIKEWIEIVGPNEPQVNGGAIYVAQENHEYNYKNSTIAEQNGEVIGIALCFEIKETSQTKIKEMDILSQTYAKLKQLAVGDYYIDSLACFPEFRGKGAGSLLIGKAEMQAQEQNHSRICLLAYEINTKAIRLYNRLGFKEIKRFPLPDVPAISFGGDIILFSKNL